MFVVGLLLLLLAFFISSAVGKRLAGGGYHYLMIQSSGEVFATGRNSANQLGLADMPSNVFRARQVPGIRTALDGATGYAHSALVLRAGSRAVAVCVGEGEHGQLGRGKFVSGSDFEQPALEEQGSVAEVFAQGQSTFAIMAGTGRVYAWGINEHGGLGIDSTADAPKPVLVQGLLSAANVTSLGVSFQHSCFLTSAGKVYCSGFNLFGQLGVNSTQSSSTPLAVVAVQDRSFTAVSCGSYHTCALSKGGEVYCWGGNWERQLGNTDWTTPVLWPTKVAGVVVAVESILASNFATYLILAGGARTAVAFGQDHYGVFGTGTAPPSSSSTPIPFGQNVTGIVELRGGYQSTCLLNVANEVWCTGQNDDGQLGVDAATTTATSTLVKWDAVTSAPVISASPTSKPTTSFGAALVNGGTTTAVAAVIALWLVQ